MCRCLQLPRTVDAYSEIPLRVSVLAGVVVQCPARHSQHNLGSHFLAANLLDAKYRTAAAPS